jgi:hypothetical protein
VSNLPPSKLVTQPLGNWSAWMAQPEVREAGGKLNSAEFSSAVAAMRQRFTGCMSFFNYLQSLIAERVRGPLLPDVQATLVARAEAALGDLNQFSALATGINKTLSACGLAALVERDFPRLFANFPHSPMYAQVVHIMRTMGVTEAQLSWVLHLSQQQKYNLLVFDGADGTIAGLIAKFNAAIPRYEAWLGQLKERGLTVFTGAMPGDGGGDGDGGGSASFAGGLSPAGGVVVVLIVLCILFC